MSDSSTTPGTLSRLMLLRRAQDDPRLKLDQLLAETIAVLDLADAVVCWPAAGAPEVHAASAADESAPEDPMKWSPEIVARLAQARSADETINDPRHRLFIPLIVEGRRNGVMAVSGREPISDEDQCTLIIMAQILARHPAFVSLL